MSNYYDQIAKEFEEQTASDDMMSKLLGNPEPLKVSENPPEIPEEHKVGASALDWGKCLPSIYV
jgi:hypothetical protein